MGFHNRAYYGDMVDRRTCVYRIYGAAPDFDLLYVGISMNLEGRITKHRRKPWWPLAAHIEVTWFDGREAAKAAERSAIHHEDPIYNVTRPRMECC